ncbi:MAG TPA: zf-HC2 domain-containing protein [Thermoanaerobaculia bacterium]
MNERSDRVEGACRPTVELLPWYVNGTLEAEESHRVERHLAGCTPCRGELALCREMATAIPAGESLAPASHPARLARLMDRLGEPPAARERPSRAGDIAGRLRRWRESVAETAPPVRWLMAGQLAAIAVLGVALVTAFLVLGGGEGSGTDPVGPGRTFRTLTDTPAAGAPAPAESTATAPVPAAGSTRIRVVFDPSLTEADIRALLLELRAQVVGGPSPLGAYTLEVPAGGADADPPEVVLDHLRAQPGVRFAEPAVAP